MTKERRGNNRNGRRGDPNQDVQPWLGWIAALLVVVIAVAAVAMGMERTSNQRNSTAEVRMTPLVGGIEMPVATSTGEAVAAASEVTPISETLSETATISMVTVITQTGAPATTDTFTATGEMTPTATLTTSLTTSLTTTGTPTGTATGAITATVEVMTSPAVTPSAEVTPTVESTATSQVTVEPASSPTPRPTPTSRPTATVSAQVFEPGDLVVASGEFVDVHADASQDSMVLDTFAAGAVLEVLDPSGDYESYPVVADGHGWARVRAEDGLVGWVMTDQVEAQ